MLKEKGYFIHFVLSQMLKQVDPSIFLTTTIYDLLWNHRTENSNILAAVKLLTGNVFVPMDNIGILDMVSFKRSGFAELV